MAAATLVIALASFAFAQAHEAASSGVPPLASQFNYVSAQCSQLPIQTVYGKGPLSFGVLGDWGRLGGARSITPWDEGGFDLTGACASRFSDTYDENVRGAQGQLSVAASLEEIAGIEKPQFVLNTGDNFYECGVDTPLRLDMDWNRVYGQCSAQNIKNLKWYNIFGNHDIFGNSVQSQLDYAKFENRWVMPCRYYAVDFVNKLSNGKNVTMRALFINNTPWVSWYNMNSGSGSVYNTPEMQVTSLPAAISEQLDWIESTLNSSTAQWNVIVGHHPMVTSSPWGFGPFAAYFNRSGESLDFGMPDANGRPAFNRLYRLINKYNVDVYFNGHDHIMAHMTDPVDPVNRTTQYITTGAGSAVDALNGCGYGARPFVKWVGANYNGNITCQVLTAVDAGRLNAVAYYYRIYLAALSVIAEQNTEAQLLDQAANTGSVNLADQYLKYMVSVEGVNNTIADIMLDQIFNATCGCANVPVSKDSRDTWLSTGQLLRAFDSGLNGYTNYTGFRTGYCNRYYNSSVDIIGGSIELVPANLTADGVIYGPVAGSTPYTTVLIAQPATDAIGFCQDILGGLENFRQQLLNDTRSMLIDQRLGDSRTTGKIAARNLIYGALRYWVVDSAPAMFDPIFTYARGTDPANDMTNANIASLQEYFLAGPKYYNAPQPAALAITRRNVYADNATLPYLASLARARWGEVMSQQADLLNTVIQANPIFQGYNYPNLTIGQLLTTFSSALGNLTASDTVCQVQGCTKVGLTDRTTVLYLPNGTMPDANDPDMGQLRTQYQATPPLGTAFPGYVTAHVDDKAFQIAFFVLPSYTSSLTQQPYNVTITRTPATPRRVVRRRRRLTML